jgi:GTP-binding protein
LYPVAERAHGSQIKLIPPRKMSLEEAIGWVAADEIIEVTPKVVRLRKRVLDSSLRKREKK